MLDTLLPTVITAVPTAITAAQIPDTREKRLIIKKYITNHKELSPANKQSHILSKKDLGKTKKKLVLNKIIYNILRICFMLYI